MPATLHPMLNVRDFDRSLAFYTALGFNVEDKWTGEDGKVIGAKLTLDGARLDLGAIASNPDPEFQKWASGPLGGGVLLHLVTPDLDAFYERVKEAGGTIEEEMWEHDYGRGFMFNDPDGYSLTAWAP